MRVFATSPVAVLLLAFGMLSLVGESKAVVIHLISGGKLIGAQNVQIGNRLYNVEFLDGRCVDLFNGCDEASDFEFNNRTDASNAASALLGQVFLDVPEGSFDSEPELTYGCTTPTTCLTQIPFDVELPSLFFLADARNSDTTDIQSHQGNGRFTDFTIPPSSDLDLNFAAFTFTGFVQSIDAPAPASGLMLLTALAGFRLLRVMRK